MNNDSFSTITFILTHSHTDLTLDGDSGPILRAPDPTIMNLIQGCLRSKPFTINSQKAPKIFLSKECHKMALGPAIR